MYKVFHGVVLAGAITASALLSASALSAEKDTAFPVLKTGQETWSEYPGIAGIQIMVVDGDPKKAGHYVIRVKFSPGTMSMPHFHPEDRFVTVIKGTWWMGTGEKFTPENTVPAVPGTYAKHPAGEAHFDGAKDEEVIVQITGIGPSATKFINPDLGTVGRSLPK